MNILKLSKSIRLNHYHIDYEYCKQCLDYLESKEEFDIYEIARCLQVTSSFIRSKLKLHGLKGVRKPFRGKMQTSFYSKELIRQLISLDTDLTKRVLVMKGIIK